MPKKDLNQLAAFIVDQATNEIPRPQETIRPKGKAIGGKKGGLARKEALTAAQRADIARTAATARWRSKRDAAAPAYPPLKKARIGV